MKVSIHERGAILRLEPALIEAYLRSREWGSVAQVADTGSIWTTRAGNQTFEVFVPSSHDVRDFPLRVSEALRSLSEVEHRSEFDLYQDILLAGNDLVVIRVPQSSGRADLNLSHAVALINHASEMMLAAACSAVSPQPAYLWRRPRRAKDYVEGLRALQISLDEPAVTILSPVPPIARLARFQSREIDPFARSVVSGLANALLATSEIMRTNVGVDQDVADSLVEHGISANLYDAIVGMLRGAQGAPKLKIEIRYAPVRPQPNPPSFDVTSREIEALEKTSSGLRRQAEGGSSERIVVTGLTVGFRRPTNSRRGQITIEQGLLFGAKRRVRVELAEAEYTLAARAHLTRSRVRVSGLLERRGRFWVLADSREFSVLSA